MGKGSLLTFTYHKTYVQPFTNIQCSSFQKSVFIFLNKDDPPQQYLGNQTVSNTSKRQMCLDLISPPSRISHMIILYLQCYQLQELHFKNLKELHFKIPKGNSFQNSEGTSFQNSQNSVGTTFQNSVGNTFQKSICTDCVVNVVCSSKGEMLTVTLNYCSFI